MGTTQVDLRKRMDYKVMVRGSRDTHKTAQLCGMLARLSTGRPGCQHASAAFVLLLPRQVHCQGQLPATHQIQDSYRLNCQVRFVFRWNNDKNAFVRNIWWKNTHKAHIYRSFSDEVEFVNNIMIKHTVLTSAVLQWWSGIFTRVTKNLTLCVRVYVWRGNGTRVRIYECTNSIKRPLKVIYCRNLILSKFNK